jgi:hypothetical protein
MENEKPVLDQEDDLLVRPAGETEQEYDARCQRWRDNELRKRREERAAQAAFEQRESDAVETGAPSAEDDDVDDADVPCEPPDPFAAEKAQQEARWAQKTREEEEDDVLRRHWEEAYRADVERRGGIAALTRDFPPGRTGRWPLPHVPKPKDERAAPYARPDIPPDDAEIELTAIIAECRYFMRAMAFESARLTPDAGDRFGFIDRACQLAKAGAKVGKTVASLRGRAPAEFKEHRQHITIDDMRRRGEGDAP